MSAKSFEDLLVWQRARVVAGRTYRVTCSGLFLRDRALVGQMRRVAVSVMSNIAEGFERRHPRDFSRFLLYAKASCAELRSQLYLAADVGFLDPGVSKSMLDELSQLGRMIGALMAKVNRR